MVIAVCILHCELCISATVLAQSVVPVGARHLVMPFESEIHDARYEWLGESAASVLTEDLTALGAETLSREDRLRAFEHLRVPAASRLSEATIIRVAQIVGAEQVIIGSFAVNGTTLTVHARPIRLDTGRRFPEIRESGPLTDVFEIFARTARRLLPDSAVPTSEMERVRPPLTAFEEYIKGVVAENPATQVVYFKEALRYAPEFQRARLALWGVYTEQGEHRQALDIVQQVPAVDPLSRQARFRAALSTMSLGRYAEAIDRFAALNRDQRDPALLNNTGVAQLRRSSQSPDGSAADLFRQALAVSPNDADLAFNLGYTAWLAHDTLTAVRWLREAVRRNPADDAAHWVLGVALQASANAAEGQRNAISPSVSRRSMSSGTRNNQVRARFRQISNASRPSWTRRALRISRQRLRPPSSATSATWRRFTSKADDDCFKPSAMRKRLPSCGAPSICRPTNGKRICCSGVCTCVPARSPTRSTS